MCESDEVGMEDLIPVSKWDNWWHDHDMWFDVSMRAAEIIFWEGRTWSEMIKVRYEAGMFSNDICDDLMPDFMAAAVSICLGLPVRRGKGESFIMSGPKGKHGPTCDLAEMQFVLQRNFVNCSVQGDEFIKQEVVEIVMGW